MFTWRDGAWAIRFFYSTARSAPTLTRSSASQKSRGGYRISGNDCEQCAGGCVGNAPCLFPVTKRSARDVIRGCKLFLRLARWFADRRDIDGMVNDTTRRIVLHEGDGVVFACSNTAWPYAANKEKAREKSRASQ